jgi:hypothetical protein
MTLLIVQWAALTTGLSAAGGAGWKTVNLGSESVTEDKVDSWPQLTALPLAIPACRGSANTATCDSESSPGARCHVNV